METAHEGTSHRGFKIPKQALVFRNFAVNTASRIPRSIKLQTKYAGLDVSDEKTAPIARKKPAIETAGGRASAGHTDTEGDRQALVMPRRNEQLPVLMAH